MWTTVIQIAFIPVLWCEISSFVDVCCELIDMRVRVVMHLN